MTQNRFLHEMMDAEGPTLLIEVLRSAETQNAQGLGVSFSPEAMTNIVDQLTTWIGTRVLRYHDASGAMPQIMKITLDVELSA